MIEVSSGMISFGKGQKSLLVRLPQNRNWETACVYLPLGSRFEDEQKLGITHLLEHFLFSAEQDGLTAHERLEQWGGVLWTQTDREYCAVGATALGATTVDLFRLLQEFMGELHLDRFEQIRDMVAGEIVQREMGPTSLLYEGVQELLFDTHPLARPIVGRPHTVGALSESDLRDFYRANVCLDRAVFVALSSQNPDAVMRQAREVLPPSSGQGRLEISLRAPEFSPRVRYKQLVADLPDVFFAQAFAFPAGAVSDQAHTMAVLATLLAGCRGSRLYRSLHYEVASGYQLSARPVFYSDCGFLLLTGRVPAEEALSVLRLTMEELHRIAEGHVTAEEIERIRQFTLYRTAIHLDDQQNQAIWLAREIHLRGEAADPFERLAETRVTPEEIARAAATMLRGPRAATLIQPQDGPSASELEGVLNLYR